jgi:hypothetical protein
MVLNFVWLASREVLGLKAMEMLNVKDVDVDAEESVKSVRLRKFERRLQDKMPGT